MATKWVENITKTPLKKIYLSETIITTENPIFYSDLRAVNEIAYNYLKDKFVENGWKISDIFVGNYYHDNLKILTATR